MNEASSDTETGSTEKENLVNSTSSMMTGQCHEILGRNLIPQVLSLPPLRLDIVSNSAPVDEVDFFTRQTRLQMEAKIALSQAKEMAHMQVEVERQKLKHSPITEMVRSSLAKVRFIIHQNVSVYLWANKRLLTIIKYRLAFS